MVNTYITIRYKASFSFVCVCVCVSACVRARACPPVEVGKDQGRASMCPPGGSVSPVRAVPAATGKMAALTSLTQVKMHQI